MFDVRLQVTGAIAMCFICSLLHWHWFGFKSNRMRINRGRKAFLSWPDNWHVLCTLIVHIVLPLTFSCIWAYLSFRLVWEVLIEKLLSVRMVKRTFFQFLFEVSETEFFDSNEKRNMYILFYKKMFVPFRFIHRLSISFDRFSKWIPCIARTNIHVIPILN